MDIKRNWRIWVLALAVMLSLALVLTQGLSFGIDFSGGTELKMELEKGGDDNVGLTTRILKERLNGLGLKSVQVLPEVDKKHITIKVSTTDPAELEQVRNILYQQAFFEQFVDGDLCAKGDEIQLDVSRTGGSAVVTGRSWQVFVRTTGDGPARCGKAMKGKVGHMTDIFLDRPREAAILLEDSLCSELAGMDFTNNADDVGYTDLEFLETRANIPVLCFTESEAEEEEEEEEPRELNESLMEELGIVVESNETGGNETEENETVELPQNDQVIEELRALAGQNITKVILSVNITALPADIRDAVEELNLTVEVVPKDPDQPFHSREDPDSWIDAVTGLKSTLEIQEGLTYGTPIYSSVFTGSSESPEEAQKTVDSYQIWLSSGNLPIKIEIVLEKPNLPEFGARFLNMSMIVALVAIILVGIVIAIRYREPKISMFILCITLSEVIIILGFASLVSWELDLAAVAGIIAAVGTGVDHQVVITDETLRGERKRSDDKRLWDVKGAINRAFFIIFTAAATTVGAMLPLMSIIDLKGFAFTTIVGVLIGIMVTRPAYARIVELIT